MICTSISRQPFDACAGVVTRYTSRTGKHKVDYDDGEIENVVLDDEVWRFKKSEAPRDANLVPRATATTTQKLCKSDQGAGAVHSRSELATSDTSRQPENGNQPAAKRARSAAASTASGQQHDGHADKAAAGRTTSATSAHSKRRRSDPDAAAASHAASAPAADHATSSARPTHPPPNQPSKRQHVGGDDPPSASCAAAAPAASDSGAMQPPLVQQTKAARVGCGEASPANGPCREPHTIAVGATPAAATLNGCANGKPPALGAPVASSSATTAAEALADTQAAANQGAQERVSPVVAQVIGGGANSVPGANPAAAPAVLAAIAAPALAPAAVAAPALVPAAGQVGVQGITAKRLVLSAFVQAAAIRKAATAFCSTQPNSAVSKTFDK